MELPLYTGLCVNGMEWWVFTCALNLAVVCPPRLTPTQYKDDSCSVLLDILLDPEDDTRAVSSSIDGIKLADWGWPRMLSLSNMMDAGVRRLICDNEAQSRAY